MDIQGALRDFGTLPPKDAARKFLAELGYRSDKSPRGLGSTPAEFEKLFIGNQLKALFDKEKSLFAEWKSADLIFQYTDAELSPQQELLQDNDVSTSILKSYIFISVELRGSDYARGKFSSIARQINRLFPQPVMVLIKHGDRLTIAIINRRYNKLDQSKDVLGKVTLIRDINITQPHRGHVDILTSLALPNLKHPQKKAISDFDTLHAAWEQILNVELLNQRFYRDLSNWYFWALKQVEFPADLEEEEEKRKATGLIRLLTRLIFCWFLKEKDLVPDALFNQSDLSKLLKEFDPESEKSSTYYQAILQNLFFATLNQRMGKDGNGKPYRGFAADEGFLKNRQTYDINNLYRYEELFAVSQEEILKAFEDIPFLNGGLFECLDRADDPTGKKMYIDGFSRNTKKRPHVPNRLFFDSGETADLSGAYGDTKRKAERVEGLVNILQRYKFTIVENTPIDQEIALDPELLGKVFENLLASYNEETKTTARKQTGSFYTPRPIVDYMVDESLKSHLKGALTKEAGMQPGDAEAGLDLLFTYTEKNHAFSPEEVKTLIGAIDSTKVLDPACGSGAFPMGALHKLVYILGKLDTNNDRWKQAQLAKIDSAPMREELERAFSDNNDDYGRKLYLIESCLYGVDIQPIAIQITKLRFFISLVCDQKTNRNKKDNHGIRPLPNLETKFVAANSLIGLPDMPHSLLVDPRVAEIEAEIDSLYHSHFSTQRRDQKLALQRKIQALRSELAKLLAEGLISPAKARHIALWDPFDPQSSADFFDPHWMFGQSLADGFDIVIANPPYVRQEAIKGFKPLLKEQKYECYEGSADLFVFFYERSVKLLREGGVLCFITPNKFYRSGYGAKLRDYLKRELTLECLIDFGDAPVFEAIAYASILTGTKLKPTAESPVIGCTWNEDTGFDNIFDTVRETGLRFPQAELRSDGWRLGSPLAIKLLDKIRNAGKPLGEYVNQQWYWGIKTGLNAAYVVDQATHDRLIAEDLKSAQVLKPLLRGRDIKRWKTDFQKFYLITIASSENQAHPWSGQPLNTAEITFSKTYPAVHKWLAQFRDELIERSDQGKYFWELRSCAYWEKFAESKIIVPAISGTVNVAFDEEGYISNNKSSIFVCDDAAYVCAIVNSKVCNWFARQVFATKQGGFFDFEPRYSSQWPIPICPPAIKKKLSTLVLKAQSEKRADRDVSSIEADINIIVTQLFGLSTEEELIMAAAENLG
jgi:adenine-specific DNA-methyltransferase